MSLKYVQTPAVALYSGLSASAVSAVITPFPVDLDGVKLTMADFGDIGRFTIDPKISGYEEICSFTGITDNGDNTATLTGLTRNLQSKSPYTASLSGGRIHGASAVVVFSDNPQLFDDLLQYINGIAINGAADASTTVKGVVKLSTAPLLGTNPIAVGTNDTRLPTQNQANALAGTGSPSSGNKFATEDYRVFSPIGMISPYAGRATPTGWLLCDGSAVSRTTYAALFTTLAPSQTFTVTSASPAVFTAVAHGLVAGDKIHFTTTGGLYSGLATNTDYFVISAGLTADAFQVSASRAGAAVNTSGSQSGIHTLYASNYGKGDGATTFNLPDFRGFTPYGQKTGDANFDILNVPNTYVGEKTHQLTVAELASHIHGSNLMRTGGFGNAQGSNSVWTSGSTDSAGGDTAHNNMSPYVVTTFIIKT